MVISILEMGTKTQLDRLIQSIAVVYYVTMTTLVIPLTVYCTAILLLGVLLLRRIFKFDILYYSRACQLMIGMTNDCWTSAANYMGLKLTEYGDDISKIANKRVLFLCNHLCIMDNFCLMTAFHNKAGLAPKYLWLIYNVYRATTVGLTWAIHGGFFVNFGPENRQKVLKDLRQFLLKKYWRHDYGWIVIFPEGGRHYLIEEAERKFAKKVGIEPFEHCAHPRIGAAHTVISTCGISNNDSSKTNITTHPPLDYVVDCTLGYPNREGIEFKNAIFAEWPNDNPNVAIHYKIYPIQSEWKDENKFKEWIYDRYAEKDKLLHNYYKTGKFDDSQPRVIKYNLICNILCQLFWFGAFYFHMSWAYPLTSWLVTSTIGCVKSKLVGF